MFCTVSARRIFAPTKTQFSDTSLHFVPATAGYVPFLPAENRLALATQFSTLNLDLVSVTLGFVALLPAEITLSLQYKRP